MLFLSLSKHFIHADSPPLPIVLLFVGTGIYLAFASPTIWLLMFLESLGIRCPDMITYVLIPVNSIIAAIIIRGVYAGVRKLIKHKAQQGVAPYVAQSAPSGER